MSRAATLTQCAILAGGLATRLGSIAENTPKPVLDIGGRPFLAWLMRELQRFGVEEFVILTGHLSQNVRQAVEQAAARLPKPARLIFSHEPDRAGTAGALHYAQHRLADRFLLCNGDSLFDANLADLLAAFATDTPDTLGRLLLRDVPDTSRYGVVDFDGDLLTRFAERPPPSHQDNERQPGTINAGIYALDRRIAALCQPGASLERDVLPPLAQQGALRGTRGHGFFIDIGLPGDLELARRDLPKTLSRPALFLDRDGVLNHNHGWVGTRDRFDWIDGALDAIRDATAAGHHVFVVTNQSGVARGLYTEDDVQTLMAWVADEARRHSGTIDDWRYCPTHPDATIPAYRRESDWRKPGPGMLLDLIDKWDLDPARCVLVGDSETDLAAATAAHIKPILYRQGRLSEALGGEPPPRPRLL